ncbi:SRPBCC domain-containing protein [Dyadobacter sp. CY326]|uniref:SRPBCC family protein n=1 Tax=Dyadobacter sp. CY326 TaxID=2907300 RepID=UPI001F401231|nr:SRPBCC domain-containing protein [Dyadobacter sp. CY326]MCE7063843.1 SRPBCC domain-containing protein [Dyadobacter sp. CY326]
MSNPLVKEFTYNVPIDEVWQALTSMDKMKKWYFPQLRGFEPVMGFKFEFDDDDAGYQKEWVVTKVVEGKTLAHSWAYKGYSGSSEIIFDVTTDNITTRLKITQTDLESFPNHPYFRRERFELGWDNLLGKNLKQLLELN